MPARLRPASIRGRLLLLVLALWLPAVIGLALQARDTYLRQAQASRDELQQQAIALRSAFDAELDRRVTLARALGSLPSLRARDFDAFDRDARMAVQQTDDAVLVVDREQQYVYTGLPTRTVVKRRPGSLFVDTGAGVPSSPKGRSAAGRPSPCSHPKPAPARPSTTSACPSSPRRCRRSWRGRPCVTEASPRSSTPSSG